MRHSLAAAAQVCGFTRTVLHATAAGFPLYRAIGFRTVTELHVYQPASRASEPSVS